MCGCGGEGRELMAALRSEECVGLDWMEEEERPSQAEGAALAERSRAGVRG